MKKTMLVVLGLVFVVTISLAFTRDDSPYKNLKILPKNITKEQMDSVMHHFTNSLNVHCNFCHVRNETTKQWDFASDDNKHKLIARDMMTMMDKINDKYFNVTGAKRNLDTKLMVTCYTCHNGKEEPAVHPPLRERPQQRPPGDSSRRNQ
jgi:hypothetical protein